MRLSVCRPTGINGEKSRLSILLFVVVLYIFTKAEIFEWLSAAVTSHQLTEKRHQTKIHIHTAFCFLRVQHAEEDGDIRFSRDICFHRSPVLDVNDAHQTSWYNLSDLLLAFSFLLLYSTACPPLHLWNRMWGGKYASRQNIPQRFEDGVVKK